MNGIKSIRCLLVRKEDKLISKLVRIIIVILCVACIGIIAYLSFSNANKISSLSEDIKIDFSQYKDIDALLMQGKEYFDEGITEYNNTNPAERDKGIKKIILANAFFKQILERNSLFPEGLMYRGITLGILAEMETDIMLKLNMINRAFDALDNAIKLKESLYLAFLYRGIFSVETPDPIFKRLENGVKDLEYVYTLHEQSSILNKEDYYSLLFYLGKGKLQMNEPIGVTYLKRVISESNINYLIKMSEKLLK
ncbi:MAG: hypothetical protein JXB88_17395 [Spirochaetales bacterium]|nr:hypothetical protein [Spirochaetales bacterium]